MEQKYTGIDCRHFINGAYVDSISKETFDNTNPATKEKLGTVANGSEADVKLAIAAAKKASKGEWRTMPLRERSQIIRKIGDLILERLDELAMLETLDTGKPLSLSRSLDIPRAAYNFHFFADYMTTIGQESYQQDDVALHYAVRKPVGVVGLINPWNLPLLLMTWKLAPALAAGNAVVMKPSEVTPMTATIMAEICEQAGVPKGVVNLVHGFGEAGAALSASEDVDAIAFTGETITGTAIMKASAPSLKKLSFELGGKNPNVIFESADIDDAVETSIRSSFLNQGEVCLCGSRVYVQKGVYDEFVEKLVERTKGLKVGDPLVEGTFVGSVVSEEHYNKVLSYLDIAREDKGTFLTGGKKAEGLPGYFIEPTIITGLDRSSRCVKEEIFGPVITILPFDTEEEVLEQVNDTTYGLAATIWTQDLKQAHRFASQIEAGIIWVNTWFLRDLRTPFGGMKHSGIGREGGAHSFDFYTELSNVTIKL
ncbi:2-hydroxymuconic semialdehyde dehydrogenase [Listeria floridensis FSL S10-1187]|uniref:2-hydroxymuconic semialdehyde dehydrogenase n=1 Tax=Listeria floridensis FSL S10-1187 TaxID=1265817 RepID=A0ABN0RC56_9LIST|nr:aldehyde dehydrogenase [Listeria floridensis]EUJ26759.1 2-hydroxymuconic semialdehyde dehydrogenase [Listeria floridensis FSL S10-1187]